MSEPVQIVLVPRRSRSAIVWRSVGAVYMLSGTVLVLFFAFAPGGAGIIGLLLAALFFAIAGRAMWSVLWRALGWEEVQVHDRHVTIRRHIGSRILRTLTMDCERVRLRTAERRPDAIGGTHLVIAPAALELIGSDGRPVSCGEGCASESLAEARLKIEAALK
jgi:hypothetical protein